MSHNTRTRVDITDWSSPTKAVTPAEMDKLDQQAFQSVNGDLGGTWAPSSIITIGGSGLSVTGPFVANGGIGLNGTISLGGTISLSGTVSMVSAPGASFEIDAPSTFGVTTINGALTANSTADFWGATTVHSGVTFAAGGNVQLGNDSSKTLDVEATSTFNAGITANNSLDVFGNCTFHTSSLVTIGGNAILGNDATKTLTVGANSTFNGTALFNQAVDCFEDVTFHTGATFNINGPTFFNGAVALGDSSADSIDVPGTLVLHGALSYAFNGRVPLRPVIGPDADHTYVATDANVVHVLTLSSPRQYTISDTGAQNGDFFEFSLDKGVPGGQTLDIRSPSGFLCTLKPLAGQADSRCKVVRILGQWRLTSAENVTVL